MPKKKKHWTELSDAALRAAAARERKQRAAEQFKLELHEQTVARAQASAARGRVSGKVKPRVQPFDPEAGRYRMARRMPGAHYVHIGMPTNAPTECPACGARQPSYKRRGRYQCDYNRLVHKMLGCGHRWVGPYNPSESPLTPLLEAEWINSTQSPPVDPVPPYDDQGIIFT